MAALVAAIHVFLGPKNKAWIAGTRPAMTGESSRRSEFKDAQSRTGHSWNESGHDIDRGAYVRPCGDKPRHDEGESLFIKMARTDAFTDYWIFGGWLKSSGGGRSGAGISILILDGSTALSRPIQYVTEPGHRMTMTTRITCRATQ